MSADTGWSLLILFPDYNFSGRISEDGSILIAHGREILINQYSISRLFFTELSLCVSPPTLGRGRP